MKIGQGGAPRVLRIEAQGFKSFADRIELPLLPGITAVVGPNGTGKSNLMDAVRWAMGEQRLKQIRAERSEDLLFAGSASRRPAPSAECALTVSNPNSQLGLDTAEVEVRRRLSRTGEMSYFVNRRPARLRDVEQILALAGLASGGYAVVGQGQVDAVLRARPRERLALIEEAAGIASLEGDRSRALATLSSGEAERASLEARREELDRRMQEIRQEAKRADRDRDLARQILACEVSLIRGRLREARRALDEQRKRVEESTMRLAADRGLLARLEGAGEAGTAALSGLGPAVSRLAERLAEVHQQRLERELEARRRSAESDRLNRVVSSHEARISELTERLRTLDLELEARRDQIPGLEERAAGLLVRVESGEAARERRAAAERTRRLAELERQLTGKTQEADAVALAFGAADSRLQALSGEVEPLGQAQEAARDAERSAHTALAADREALRRARARYEQARERVIRAQAERAGRREGHGADLVLEAAAKGHLQGVVGLLGDLLAVPESLTVAIDSALGGAVSDVVVSRSIDAEAAVEYLRARSGRATFLPLDGLRPRAVRPAPVQEGVLGVASDLVNYEADVRLAVLHRLGSVWVVTTLAVALAVGRQSGMSHRIVTREGDLLQPGGAITGGAARSARPRGPSLASLRSEEEAARIQVAGLERAIADGEASQEARREESAGLGQAVALKRLEVEAATREVDGVRRRLAAVKLEVEQICQEQQGLLAIHAEALKSVAGDADGVEPGEDLALDGASDVLTRYREAQEALGQVRTRIAVVDEAIRAAHTDIAREEEAMQVARRALAEVATEPQEGDGTGPGDGLGLEERLRRASAEGLRLQSTLDRLMRHVGGARGRLEVGIATVRAQRTGQDQELLRRQGEVEALQTQIERDYGPEALTGTDPHPGEGEMDGIARRLERLRMERAGLGPVWQGAADALEALENRHSALADEIETLENARQALIALAESARRRMEAQVGRTLAQVRTQFAEIAQSLLGGRGDLISAEEGGIAISLVLPGKRRTDLTALSGGERALGALAFLFALMTVRPSALVVLDEVDAALDGHNAASFARHLRSVAQEQQFLVITHQRPVMEGADSLIGVTSREGGVTQLVTVHLSGDLTDDMDSQALALR